MKSEIQAVTGGELLAAAKKQIGEELFQQAIGEQHFNDFVRICILMSLSATMTTEEQQFGHTFKVRNRETGDVFKVDFDIKVNSKKIKNNKNEGMI